MAKGKPFWVVVLFLCATVGSIGQDRVAALPGAESPVNTIDLFGTGTTADITGIPVAPGIFKAVAAPNGARVFFLSNSAGRSYLHATTSSGQPIPGAERIPVGATATTMVMAPAGHKLVVLAGSVYVFDVSGNSVVSQGAVQGGEQEIASPIDVAVSHDGRRAFITGRENKLYAVDLAINAVSDTLDLPSYPNGVAIAPNGMVYVGSHNSLIEIRGSSEGGSMTLRSVIGLPVTTVAAKPISTPSGRFILLRNLAPTGPAVVVYDVLERTAKPIWLLGGTILSDLVAIADDAFYGISAGRLYRGEPRLTFLNPASLSNQNAASTTFFASAVSTEVPRARMMYLATSLGEIWRVDIAANLAQRKPGTNPVLNYVWPARTGTPATALGFSKTQTVGKGGRTLPLVVRAIGQDGQPLAGVPVSWFAPDFAGMVAMEATNIDGYAQAVLVAPDVEGSYRVSATLGSLAQTFDVTVSGSGSGGGNIGSPAGVHIVRGNGQIITSARSMPAELEVEVRDETGSPISGAIVRWAVSTVDGTPTGTGVIQVPFGTSGCTVAPGGAQEITCVTGDNGRALVLFSGTNPDAAPARYTVTASAGEYSADFIETVLPDSASVPQATIEHPEPDTVIQAPIGTPVPRALRILVTEKSGSARPLPKVAVSVSTIYDASNGPTASCKGSPMLTDADGRAECELVGGGKIGKATLQIELGGIHRLADQLWISVVPGPAKTITLQRGDNQSGLPGQRLPIPLLAEMKDASGNLLQYANTTFEVVKGSAIVAETSKQSDYRGQVSTFLTLGSLPGDVEVLVKSGVAQATFKATVKGPAVSKATFLNGASFLPGIALGGIVTAQAKGLLTGAPEIALGQCVTGADAAGKLPVRLANMEFLFGDQGIAAPIFSVCRIGADQGQANLQLPWEVPAGAVKLKVRTGIGSETPFDVDVPGIEVLNAMPGVFTWITENKTIAVANRVTGGAVITPSNPARPGEILRIFATGLGPVVPSAETNQYGAPGQKPEFTPVVILGGVGAGEVTSAYAEGMISVFSVDFKVPAVPLGDLKLKLGVQTAPDTVVYGPEVVLPVAAVQ